mgnify:FL=1
MNLVTRSDSSPISSVMIPSLTALAVILVILLMPGGSSVKVVISSILLTFLLIYGVYLLAVSWLNSWENYIVRKEAENEQPMSRDIYELCGTLLHAQGLALILICTKELE